ncbi:hypothetical protein U9M48_008086 [Paspalum notatum var. saurae]|uniref:Reverse transcriptase zinc-binding domain-containing protein n=1 Tax=Paspalum notatum var. saurae TaxID=547442 RepID=A0AAQ3SNT0_PASNO
MQLFGCNSSNLPMRYLSIPIHYRRLSNIDRRKVEERFEKRLSSWKSKHLSTGGRLTLINSVLSSLPMYMMPFFAIPKGVLKKLDYFRSRFFWQCDERKRKYRLAKWDILCQPEDQRGLGIHGLDVKNTALLSKWLYNLLISDGTWQQILRNKFLKHSEKMETHIFGACLMKVKHDFLRFGTFLIKNGSQVRFWKDRWLEQLTLPRYKQATVAVVLGTSLPNISWRRDLIGNKLAAWNNLLPRLANGSKQCCFCHKDETIKHLFFECRFARAVIFSTIHWLRSWAILQKPSSQDLVIAASQCLAQDLVFGLCSFFYLLGAWQKCGSGGGDRIQNWVNEQTKCAQLPNLNFETHHKASDGPSEQYW